MCLEGAIRGLCLVGSGACFVGKGATRLMKKDVKMAYGINFLLFSGFLMIMLYFGGGVIKFAGKFIDCPEGESLETCLGLSAVYRLSFVLATLHLLIGLSCLTRDKFAKVVNEQLWGLKLLVVVGGFIGTLFISNDSFFIPYAKITLYLSGLFLFAQAVSLIDAFYLWADLWAEKFDNGNKCYGCLLITCSLGMYLGAGYFIYSLFKDYWIPGCGWNIFWIIVMIVTAVVFIVLIVLKFHPNGSIITSGAITIFGIYLFWAAFITDPRTECNPSYSSKTNMVIQILASMGFGFACTVYWAVTYQGSKAYDQSKLPSLGANEGDEEVEKETEQIQKEQDGDDSATNLVKVEDTTQFVEYENNSYLKFHAFMMLFAFYICAVFTNWGHASISDTTWNYEDSQSSGPYYIKIAIGIFTYSLYLWTVVAPTLFPERDFNTQ